MDVEGLILDVTPADGEYDRSFLEKLGHPVLVCHADGFGQGQVGRCEGALGQFYCSGVMSSGTDVGIPALAWATHLVTNQKHVDAALVEGFVERQCPVDECLH